MRPRAEPPLRELLRVCYAVDIYIYYNERHLSRSALGEDRLTLESLRTGRYSDTDPLHPTYLWIMGAYIYTYLAYVLERIDGRVLAQPAERIPTDPTRVPSGATVYYPLLTTPVMDLVIYISVGLFRLLG